MKIRIKGNSVRYRLSRTEVAHFKTHGIIEECTQFGDEKLTYVLLQGTGEQLTATFKNNIITMTMPVKMASEWTDTNKVGFENTANLLLLCVEKDFQCLDNITEDQSDNYPNPLAAKVNE